MTWISRKRNPTAGNCLGVKIIFPFLFIMILFPILAFSQDNSHQSFMDKVQSVLGIRRTFDVSSDLRLEQDDLKSERTRKITIGFGIKL